MFNSRYFVIYNFYSLWCLLCIGANALPHSYKDVRNFSFTLDTFLWTESIFMDTIFRSMEVGATVCMKSSLLNGNWSTQNGSTNENLAENTWPEYLVFGSKFVLYCTFGMCPGRNFHVTSWRNEARPLTKYVLNTLTEGENKRKWKREWDVRKESMKLENTCMCACCRREAPCSLRASAWYPYRSCDLHHKETKFRGF